MVVLWRLNKFNLQTIAMSKTLIHGILTVFLFFATWFVLTKIDWVSVLKVKKAADKTETKLGELFWESFERSERVNNNPFVVKAVDSMVSKICASNNIDRKHIKVHIIQKDDVNAFALPDGHLVIYTGLISKADKQEELCGVIGHELAHIELNHIMKKLIKEVGLSALISMTTGNNGAEIIKETTKMLSSTAFDRSLEKDADLKAVDYLTKAKINPAPFADFLYKLSDQENEAAQYLIWMSTHPDSKARAEYIVEYCKNKKANYEKVLTPDNWNKLKEFLVNRSQKS